MGTADVYEQEEMTPTGRGQCSPACTHMAISDKNEVGYMERAQSGLRGDTEEVREQWSPACTHMVTSNDDDQLMASSVHTHTHESTPDVEGLRDFLQDMLHAESVSNFLLDSTKVHVWTDGSEIRGRAGYGVYFPHAKDDNIGEPVVGPQTNNRADVSAAKARIRAVRNTQKLCLYGDSKWCVHIFNNYIYLYGPLQRGGGGHCDAKWEIFQFSPFFSKMSFRRGRYVKPFQNLQEMAVSERYGFWGGRWPYFFVLDPNFLAFWCLLQKSGVVWCGLYTRFHGAWPGAPTCR